MKIAVLCSGTASLGSLYNFIVATSQEKTDILGLIIGAFFLILAAVLGMCLKHMTNSEIHVSKADRSDSLNTLHKDDISVSELVTDKMCEARSNTVKAEVEGLRAGIKIITQKQTESCELLKEVIKKLA